MSDNSYWTNCRNCGKQIKLDGGDPDEKCYFCERPALKKKERENISENMTEKREPEITNTQPDAKIILHIAPPRPDVSGMNKFKKNIALHKYYEDNVPAILADYKRLGNTAARKRWGFSDFGWKSFLRRHGEPVGSRSYKGTVKDGPSKPALKKAKLVRILEKGLKASNIARETPPPPPPDEKGNYSKPKSTEVDEGNLPVKFPELNDQWDNTVKIAWLETFIKFKTLQMIAGLLDKESKSPKGNWLVNLFKRGRK